MYRKTLLILTLCSYAALPLAAQPPAPAPTGPAPQPVAPRVDPGEPKNQPQVAHDHDGDGKPDHSPEEHGTASAAGGPWDGVVGPGVFIAAGLAVMGIQRAVSVRRHRQTSGPSAG